MERIFKIKELLESIISDFDYYCFLSEEEKTSYNNFEKTLEIIEEEIKKCEV